jgi:membrane protease YdiL (CAAX protease family)
MNGAAQTRKSIFTFLAITLALSTIFYVLFAIRPADVGLLNFGFMWCPGVAALLTRWLFKIKSPGTGWKPGPWRYWLLAYLLPLAYCLVVYGLIWLTGIAPFKGESLLPVLTGVLIASVVSNISTLGEEIGWRGFLVPQLYSYNGFSSTALISGVVWTIWHMPAMVILYLASGAVTLYNLVMLAITLISLSFIFAWLRLKSNSIWPAVILHTSHATFIASFDQLTASSALSSYLSGDMGAIMTILMVILAVVIWRISPQTLPGKEYEPALPHVSGTPGVNISA